jgi:hypothetical protein
MIIFNKLLYFSLVLIILQTYGDSIPVLTLPHDTLPSPSLTLLPDWSHMILNKKLPSTIYEILSIDKKTVVRATAQSSASAFMRKVSINIKEYPIIEWNWKITSIFKQGNVTDKNGNDYPAALCIKFPAAKPKNIKEKVAEKIVTAATGDKPPSAGLDYIWASNTPIGTIVTSPYTGKLKLIIVESGFSKANQWVLEQRNIYQDYKKAFGKEPDSTTSAVLIMTDSDNTDDTTTSFYGNIIFKKKK